ncbi:ABC transporter permease [Leucobacter salsicius]|uniref:ABC transporter permease n=1 Tax=Leucobacter salsicius TaxID=664638 RepID=UPI0003467A5F|nr:ABC transporter permease [Leucobacter salsicius]
MSTQQVPVPPVQAPRTTAIQAPGGATTGRRSKRSDGSRQKLSATLIIGLVLIGLVAAAAIMSFIWTPYDPTQAMPADRLQGSSPAHLMGTDKYGRDVFSAMLYGARITLFVGVISVGIAILIGTPLGILAGIRGGWIEEVIMRTSDIALAFPALLLAIMFSAVFGASTLTAMVAIGIATIPGFARVARSGTLQVMSTEYILAARAASQSRFRIALRHVLPNIIGIVVVQSSVSFALAVLAEAGLSFLGLGTPPPTPSWGRMLQESQQFLGTEPMLAVWPGLAIAIAVMGFNLLGDGLRDRFDPKLNGSRS